MRKRKLTVPRGNIGNTDLRGIPLNKIKLT